MNNSSKEGFWSCFASGCDNADDNIDGYATSVNPYVWPFSGTSNQMCEYDKFGRFIKPDSTPDVYQRDNDLNIGGENNIEHLQGDPDNIPRLFRASLEGGPPSTGMQFVGGLPRGHLRGAGLPANNYEAEVAIRNIPKHESERIFRSPLVEQQSSYHQDVDHELLTA